MYRVAKAMTWEFVRHWWWILAATVAMASMVILRSWALSFWGLSFQDSSRQPDNHHLIFPLGFVASMCAVLPALCETRLGFIHRLYTKPVPTWLMVAWKMMLGALVAALMYVVSASVWNGLLGADFALIGPACFFATGVAVVASAIWSLADFRLWKLAICAAGLILLTVWFSQCYWGGGLWTQPTIGELLSMSAFVVAAYVFAVFSVARDRCGETRPWPDLQQFYNRVVEVLAIRRSGFRSASSAHFWFEWRPRGLAVPGMAAVFLGLPVLILLCQPYAVEELIEVLLGNGLVAGPVLSGLLVGLFIGDRQKGKRGFDTFVATRPISDSQLAFVVLKASAASTIVAWLVSLSGILVGALSVLLRDGPAAFQPFAERLSSMHAWEPPFLVLVSLGFALVLSGWSTTIMLAGRWWFVASAWFAFWGTIILIVVVTQCKLVTESTWPMVQVLLVGGGIALTLVTAYAFFAARRRGFIGHRAIYSSVALWLVSSAAVVFALQSSAPPSVIVLMCGILALTLGPMAVAPLALGWNRHR